MAAITEALRETGSDAGEDLSPSAPLAPLNLDSLDVIDIMLSVERRLPLGEGHEIVLDDVESEWKTIEGVAIDIASHLYD